MVRSLTLAAYWDDQTKPAVLASAGPISSVIAHGTNSALSRAPCFFEPRKGRSFNCLISMPFRHSARVVLSNDSKKDVSNLFYDVDFWIRARTAQRDALYFQLLLESPGAHQIGVWIMRFLPRVTGRGRLLESTWECSATPITKNSWVG